MAKEIAEKKTASKKKGIVISDAMDKTVVVEVTTLKTLKKYHKKYRDTKKFSVHDEENSAKIGDEVIFRACRPISKSKKWTLVSKKAEKSSK